MNMDEMFKNPGAEAEPLPPLEEEIPVPQPPAKTPAEKAVLRNLHKEGKELIKQERFSRAQVIAIRSKFLAEAYAKGTPCAKCGRTTMLSVDHIVPVSILAQLGVDVEHEIDLDDLQIMCSPCNSYKANRLDFTNPKTKTILLKYLNRL